MAIPISDKAPAKPNPCKSPKPKAINHGLFTSDSALVNSYAKYIIVSAIKASVLAEGSLKISKTEIARVILCAKVNAVIVLNNGTNPEIKKIRPSTNTMWSSPPSRCSTPK